MCLKLYWHHGALFRLRSNFEFQLQAVSCQTAAVFLGCVGNARLSLPETGMLISWLIRFDEIISTLTRQTAWCFHDEKSFGEWQSGAKS